MAFWEDRRKDCDCDCSWKTVAIWAGVLAVGGGLVAVLIVAFAVVYPPKATVDDAVLTRFELTPRTPSSTANSSTMSYNTTVTLSLSNPNIHRGINYGPMVAAFSFNESLFDDSDTVRAFEQGARKKATVRLMAGGVDRPVRQLSAAGVAEFGKEKAAGKFAVEVRLDTVMQYKGCKAQCPLGIICPRGAGRARRAVDGCDLVGTQGIRLPQLPGQEDPKRQGKASTKLYSLLKLWANYCGAISQNWLSLLNKVPWRRPMRYTS